MQMTERWIDSMIPTRFKAEGMILSEGAYGETKCCVDYGR